MESVAGSAIAVMLASSAGRKQLVKTFTNLPRSSVGMALRHPAQPGPQQYHGVMGDADDGQIPAGSGRARDLVGRRRQRKAADTGRVHHLGAAPRLMPVLEGDKVETSTRTAAVQLAARTRWELEQLLADIDSEMAAAAAALDFEQAGRLRDELGRVRAELDRRPSR